MTELKTHNGTFLVDEGGYRLNDTRDGVNIELRFVPGPNLDATAFGMVQIANSIVGGTPEPINGNPVIRHHSIPADRPGAGFHVDQDPVNRNPLFAVNGQPAGSDDLGEGEENAFFGEIGWHYRDAGGELNVNPASLRDRTHLANARERSAQRFETACLVVGGADAGTYCGSVSWGWETDEAGEPRLLPLSLVSLDLPSDVFLLAAEIWNRSSTSSGEPTLPLPLMRPAAGLDLAALTAEQLRALAALLRSFGSGPRDAPKRPAARARGAMAPAAGTSPSAGGASAHVAGVSAGARGAMAQVMGTRPGARVAIAQVTGTSPGARVAVTPVNGSRRPAPRAERPNAEGARVCTPSRRSRGSTSRRS